jgi:four helix bundle protein
MAKGDDIEERLIDFAVRIINVFDSLPNSAAARHVRGQLIRSGTSPAPNYGEARAAESSKDFVHKLKVVLKELNENRIWLKIIIRSNMLPGKLIANLLDECDQLCRIISASIQTAKQSAPS